MAQVHIAGRAAAPPSTRQDAPDAGRRRGSHGAGAAAVATRPACACHAPLAGADAGGTKTARPTAPGGVAGLSPR